MRIAHDDDEGATTDYGSPLYGRSTGQHVLLPLTFDEAYGGTSHREAVEEYAFTGGIPYYIALMDPDGGVIGNIESLRMRRGGALVNEAGHLMGADFRDVGSYNTYLRIISEGNRRLGDIASAAQTKATPVTPYLAKLIGVGIVQRGVPVTERHPERSKTGLYSIGDCFLATWFGFVYEYRDDIQRGSHSAADRLIEEHFIDPHVSPVFGKLSRDLLRRTLESEGRDVKSGSFRNGKGEIDAVAADRRSGDAWAGECRLRASPVGADVLESLIDRCGRVREFEGSNVTPCLLSVSGFADAAKELASKTGALLFDSGNPV